MRIQLVGEQSCQISSRSDLKRWKIRLFLKRSPTRPNKNKKKKSKMSSDRRSVPDQKQF